MTGMLPNKPSLASWRMLSIAAFVVGSLAAIFLIDPISQDPAYHNFADGRLVLGVPNAFNVLSNVFFLVVGLIGLRTAHKTNNQPSHTAWLVFFAGVLFVGIGSAYYPFLQIIAHWCGTGCQ